MKFGGESRKLFDSAFQIDELHRHNQNLVGRLYKGVPTVVYPHENCCIFCSPTVFRPSSKHEIYFKFYNFINNIKPS